MKSWYKLAATFGTDPFGSGELTSKVTTSPFGEAGGDVNFGILEPSDSTKNHHPSDYFSEKDHSNLTEEQLEEMKRNRRRRKKILKKKIEENLKSSNSASWYKITENKCLENSSKANKTAQFGSAGPLLPTFGADNWLGKTYQKVKNIQNKKTPMRIPTKKKRRKRKEESSLLPIGLDGSTKALAVNDRIVVTASKLLKDQIKIKIGDKVHDGTLLVSNKGLAAIALKEDIDKILNDGDFSHVHFGEGHEVSLAYIKYWLKNNDIVCKI